jgi:hypothetical protein
MWNLLIGLVVSGDSENLEILDQEMLDYRMPMTQDVNRQNVDDCCDFEHEVLYELDWQKIKKKVDLNRGSLCSPADTERYFRVLEEDSEIPIKKYLFCADHTDFMKLKACLNTKYPSLDFDDNILDVIKRK